jgi:hypothetical protein
MRRAGLAALLVVLSSACSGPSEMLGADAVAKPRTTFVCVGTDESGAIVTLPPSANGTCAPGFDLRPWT